MKRQTVDYELSLASANMVANSSSSMKKPASRRRACIACSTESSWPSRVARSKTPNQTNRLETKRLGFGATIALVHQDVFNR